MAFLRNKDNQNDEAQVQAVESTAVVETAVTPTNLSFADKKKLAAKKMIERKKAATATLVEFAKRMGANEPEVIAAATYLSGEGRISSPRTGAAKVDLVATLFPAGVGSTVTETEVFKATKMGRSEMRAFIKKAVNNGAYIAFDAVNEIYTFASNGEEPAGWTGPKAKAAKL